MVAEIPNLHSMLVTENLTHECLRHLGKLHGNSTHGSHQVVSQDVLPVCHGQTCQLRS